MCLIVSSNNQVERTPSAQCLRMSIYTLVQTGSRNVDCNPVARDPEMEA
jgi:hypothetical protein